MKNFLSEMWPYALGALVGFGLVIGFAYLINGKESQYKKAAEEGCKQVSELAGVKKWQIDDDYNCLFVKDGELIKVKDW